MNWWHYNGAVEELSSNSKQNEISLEEKSIVPISTVSLNNNYWQKTCNGKKKIENQKRISQKNDQSDNGSVRILIIPKSSDDEQVIFLKEKFREWNKILLYPKIITKLVETLEDIHQHFNKKCHTIADQHDLQLLQGRLQTHVVINGGKTTENILLGWRVFYQISYHITNDRMGDVFIQQKLPESIYGMLFSKTNYYNRYSPEFLRAICFESLDKPLTMDAQNLESLLKVINLFGFEFSMSERLWCIICWYLESKIERVREILLLLFMHLIKDETFLKNEILPRIFTSLSWHTCEKYDLIKIVLARYSYHSLLRNEHLEKFLKPDYFFNGIMVSLTDASLMVASSKLLKVLVKQTSSLGNNFIIKYLKFGSYSEVQNLATHFAKHINMTEIYGILQLEILSLNEFERDDRFEYLRQHQFSKLVLFRRMFCTSFADHVQLESLDDFIKTHCSQHPDLKVREQVLEIWLKNMMTNTGNFGQSINNSLDFIRLNALVENHPFHSYLLQQIPKLLKYFISNVPVLVNGKKLNVNQLHLVDIVLKFECMYLDGKYEHHHEIIVHLTIFLEFLNYFKDRTFLSTFICSQLKFPKVNAKMQSLVQKLLVHTSDEIRVLSLQVQTQIIHLTADEPARYEETFSLLKSACLACIVDVNIDNCLNCTQYVKLMMEMAVKHHVLRVGSNTFSKTIKGILKTKIEELVKNPNDGAACHIFVPILCLHEICSSIDVAMEDAVESQEVINWIKDITLTILRTVYSTINGINGLSTGGKRVNGIKQVDDGTIKINGTSNGLTGKNGSTHLRKVDSNVHKAVFHTLKSCAHFSALLATHSLDNHQIKLQHSFEIIKVSIQIHKSIFFQCTNSAVIEEACLSLGRIIECLTARCTEKLYSFYDATIYDDILGVVKTELVDVITDREKLLRLPHLYAVQNNFCKAIACICKNDTSYEITLLNYCLHKVLSAEHPVHVHQLLAILQARNFTEKDRQCFDEILVFTLNLNASQTDVAGQLFDIVISKLTGSDSSLCTVLGDLPHQFPKAWQFVSTNVGVSTSHDLVVLKFLSKFEQKALLYFQLHQTRSIKSNSDEIVLYLKKLEAQSLKLQKLPEYIYFQIKEFFCSTDTATKMACLSVVNDSIRKYKEKGKYVFWHDENELLLQFREFFESALLPFGNLPLNVRATLLDLLIYLEFRVDDKIVFELISNTTTCTSTTLDRTVWMNKISRILNNELMIKKRK